MTPVTGHETRFPRVETQNAHRPYTGAEAT